MFRLIMKKKKEKDFWPVPKNEENWAPQAPQSRKLEEMAGRRPAKAQKMKKMARRRRAPRGKMKEMGARRRRAALFGAAGAEKDGKLGRAAGAP